MDSGGFMEPDVEAIVAEAERRGREQVISEMEKMIKEKIERLDMMPELEKVYALGKKDAMEEVRKAAIQTVTPLSLTLDGEGGMETVDIVAVPKSFFES